MRPLLFGLLAIECASAPAQTTTSVQDGDWGDPATWDCACIPEVVDAVVMHQVRIAGNTFLMQRVHVMPVGSLVMDQYFSVAIMDTVINDGLLDLIGDIDVDWALFNNGTIRIEGVIHNDALLVMGGPDALLAADNIGNYDTIEGEGRICVAEFSENTGTIHGLIDFCDATPSVAAPPFIDVSTGTVAGSVTFCAAAPCGPQRVHRVPASTLRIGPNPANDHVIIELPASTSLIVRDASGRAVLDHGVLARGPFILDVSLLSAGVYTITAVLGTAPLTHRLVVAR